ncbi:MAG: SIS domain-containing protein [Chitinophagaceae bacterium]|nr:SIS domain-containing protein [Chitinophagaceae bacterium]
MAESQATGIDGSLILGRELAYWEQRGAQHTAREIQQQPRLWEETWQTVNVQKAPLEEFLTEAYAHSDLEIILTGAGSSAFIGEILAGPFQHFTQKKTSAYATTNLITHPQHFFNPDRTLLLVSFARSGNSPESVAAMDMANKFCKKVYHLVVTCSSSGKLARNASSHPSFVFLLPDHANDQALAMTGSFSSMLLAGHLIARLQQLPVLHSQVQLLCAYGQKIISDYATALEKVAQLEFDRAVFLGSGPLYGTALESHLKVQELTDGQIICKFDSFLGLRHGPKVVISPRTILVYLLSNDPYAHLYEKDLLRNIHDGEKGRFQIAIAEHAGTAPSMADMPIILSDDDSTSLEEDFLSVCNVLPSQLLGLYKSIQLGLEPDQPSRNGTITRVVQGVTIYPVPNPLSLKENH